MATRRKSIKTWLFIFFSLVVISLASAACTSKEPEIGSVKTTKMDGMQMVYVPAGVFLMGTTNEDIEYVIEELCEDCNKDAFEDEKPQHSVYLDAYWIDKTEVTNSMFEKFVSATGYETDAEKAGSAYAWSGEEWGETEFANWRQPQGRGSKIDLMGEYPVVLVSWNDAVEYCRWAGKRLPTEAEWEKAARGTEGSMYPWGDEFNSSLANVDDEYIIDDYQVDCSLAGCDGYDLTAPAGSFENGASPYGALDMSGNVWEWTADWYAEDYYSQSSVSSPQGPLSGEYHVARGGSWANQSWRVRSASRGWYGSDNRIDYMGFRCVLPAGS